MLKVGDRFEYFEGEPGIHEVVRVSPCSALVRPIARRHVVIEDHEGGVKAEFDAPVRVTPISLNSHVRMVE